MKSSVPRKVVLIGASTGGPGIIQKIITALPQLNDVSFIIAQHMARGFIQSFAKRLQGHSLNTIGLVHNGQFFESGNIYLCCGHAGVLLKDNILEFTQENSPEDAFNPDINLVFNSFIPFTQEIKILSIILTGIGDDGVSACKDLSIKGARCLTQKASSAVVDGMPSHARESVPNIEILDTDTIIKTIQEFCS